MSQLCEAPRLGFTEAYIITACTIVAITLYIICSFIFYLKQEPITRVSKKKGPTKFLRNTGFILFITILLTYSIQIWGVYSLCTNGDNHALFEDIVSLSFSLETNVLLLVWFASIYHVLISTPFKMNKFTIILYSLSFIIHFGGAIVNIVITDHQEIEDLILFVLIIVYIFQLVMLLIMFPVKLCKVYAQDKEFQKQFEGKEWLNKKQKAIKAKQDKMVTLVTRLCILFYVQICTSFMGLVIFIIIGNQTLPREFAQNMVILLDLFKNFICVVLAYTFYDRFYYKFCGSCHHRMVPCISRCSFCCIMLPGNRSSKKGDKQALNLSSRTDITDQEALEIKSKSTNGTHTHIHTHSPIESDYGGTPTPEPAASTSAVIMRNNSHKQTSADRVPDDTITKTVHKSTFTGNELVVRTNSNNIVNDLVPIDSDMDVDVASADEDSKLSGFNVNNSNHTPILVLMNDQDSNNVSKFSNDIISRGDSNNSYNLNVQHKPAGSESRTMTVDDRSSGDNGGNNSNGADSNDNDENYYSNDHDPHPKKLSIEVAEEQKYSNNSNSSNNENLHSNIQQQQQRTSFIMMPIMAEDASGEEYIGSGIGTQTAQMEEILSGILDYSNNDEENFSKYGPTNLIGAHSNRFSQRTSANNTDNEREESEIP